MKGGPLFPRRAALACGLSLLAAACESTEPEEEQPDLYLQLGHSRPISSMEFSPDGELLLTGGEDASIRVWDLGTAREVRRWGAARSATVEEIGFLKGGWIVGTRSSASVLWNPATGEERAIRGWAWASPSGTFLVREGVEVSGYQLCSPSGETVHEWVPDDGQALIDARFSPDDRYLLAEFADVVSDTLLVSHYERRQERLLDTRGQTEVRWFAEFDEESAAVVSETVEAITAMPAFRTRSGWSGTFSPEGELFVVSSSEYLPQLRTSGRGERVPWFDEGRTPYRSTHFHPDGRSVLTYDGLEFELRELPSGEELWTLPNPFRRWPSIAFSPTGKFLLATSERKERSGFMGLGTTVVREVHLWDTETTRELDWAGRYPLSAESARMSPDESILATSVGQVALLYETSDGTEVARLGSAVLESRSMALSPDGRWLFADGAGVARVWDLEQGREVVRWRSSAAGIASFSTSSDYLEIGRELREVPTFRVVTAPDPPAMPESPFTVPAAPALPLDFEAAGDEGVILVDRSTGQRFGPFPHAFDDTFDNRPRPSISEDGRYLLTSDESGPRLFEVRSGERLDPEHWADTTTELYFWPADPSLWNVLAPGGRRLIQYVTGSTWSKIRIWDLDADRIAFTGDWSDEGALSVGFSDDGRYLAAVGGGAVQLWKRDAGLSIPLLGHLDSVTGLSFGPDSRWVATVSTDRTVRLWSPESGTLLCTLASLESNEWLVTDPVGRFDTSNLDETSGMGWVMPDDPLRSLPVEIFLREYFEPGLLSKILAGERLPAIRDITALNRALPVAHFVGERASPDGAFLEIELRVQEGEYARGDSKAVEQRSGAYDLRVFRDGVLVTERPPPDPGLPFDARDLQAWRNATRIELDEESRSTEYTLRVALPQADPQRRFELSAYAFNEDGVKGPTAFFTHVRETASGGRPPRAVVVSVGVDRIEGAGLSWSNLSFAARDAREIQRWFLDRLTKADQPPEVDPHLLLSERGGAAGGRGPGPTATKDEIRQTLLALAGETGPDDLVLFTYSGHGYVARSGEFYLFPYDTGPRIDAQPKPAQLERLVSATEIATWLRGVDARRIVLIIDACQAAGAVESRDFKPGPYTSRGLGQLAYDKRALILVATQSQDVAVGSGELGHSLLTEAVLEVAPGFETRARIDPFDLGPLLARAAREVPSLHAEYVDSSPGARVQEPSLFDFDAIRSRVIESLDDPDTPPRPR